MRQPLRRARGAGHPEVLRVHVRRPAPRHGSRWSRRRGRRSDRTSPRRGWCATTPPTCTNRRPRSAQDLTADNGSLAAELAAWRRHVQASWPSVSITSLDVDTSAADTGVSRPVTVTVAMDGLDPGDLRVDVLHGTVGPGRRVRPRAGDGDPGPHRRRHVSTVSSCSPPPARTASPPGSSRSTRRSPRPTSSAWPPGPADRPTRIVLGGLRSISRSGRPAVRNLSFGRPDRPPGCPNVGP